MPNWATNTIRFEGTPEAIERLREAVVSDGTRDQFDFNKINPCPEELYNIASPLEVVATEEEAAARNKEWNSSYSTGQGTEVRAVSVSKHEELIEAYGASDWYDWCTEKWGTKWTGSDAAILDSSDTHLTVYFVTAWSAPAGIFTTLREEWGMTLVGGTIHEDGSEFELHGDWEAFQKYFRVEEVEEIEDYGDGETYARTWRTIDLL